MFPDIPDDPRIRDAELNGMPDAGEVHCPVCGEECEEIYQTNGGDVVGCDRCIERVDAYDWRYDQEGW